ncbi:transcriptional regulator [Streptomyces marincola]|uniref:Transcriptional regulator n=1 Tax=Streptomyces marincola TaxID=2878388 RepID=A0A1W7D618_9ACTN|nr:transcriptional regulator [Streptomyces marincola]ARQ72531.1 transcriptional regulator [Streptomyces marincola]
MEPNTLLSALLEEADMSHVGLATRVNAAGKQRGLSLRYDNTAVIRWLRGQKPRGQVPDLICSVLSARLGRQVTLDSAGFGPVHATQAASPTLAGFLDRATALWLTDDQRRVRSLHLVTGMDAVAPVWQWESPPGDVNVSHRGPIHVGREDIAFLMTVRSHYEHMYRRVGGVATRGRILQFLTKEVTPLLRGNYSDPVGRELYRAVGGLTAVAGICSYDSDRQGLAQRYFYQSLRLAKASSDRRFGGYVMALLVNQAVYMKDYRQAVAFAEAGIRAAGTHISPALAADLHAMQAKAFARMGDRASAHRCMASAETAAGRIRADEEPVETGYVQPGLVQAHFAEVLMSLGDTGPAQTYAAEAVHTEAHTRGTAHRLATLARTQAAGGEVERAAFTATKMVSAAQGIESRRIRDRLTSVRTVLSRCETITAGEAIALIDGALHVPLD